MSLLDIDLKLVDLVELVELNKSPLNDIKKFTRQCDIGLIEGGEIKAHDFLPVIDRWRTNIPAIEVKSISVKTIFSSPVRLPSTAEP